MSAAQFPMKRDGWCHLSKRQISYPATRCQYHHYCGLERIANRSRSEATRTRIGEWIIVDVMWQPWRTPVSPGQLNTVSKVKRNEIAAGVVKVERTSQQQ